ncbi:hypothetical protein Ccrd_026762 [Cynara cardunculus var. scolymus]|uniref:Uncharacterized protein n=1 Tax=Cynara cardunculus var. scolymus TaxID=59895 RepID=A0A103K6N0_CYNCS|nr:hypothetical protein Ccrd_026762 [Cynara cardunculus var. scolymus]
MRHLMAQMMNENMFDFELFKKKVENSSILHALMSFLE